MPTIIIHGNIRLTPALEVFVGNQAEKLNRLTKRFKTGAIIRIELDHMTRHHKKGPVFRAEINYNLPGTRKSGTFRAEAINENLRTALIEATSQIAAQLQKYRDRLNTRRKKAPVQAR